MPSWYRWAVVVVATLLLCSCSAPIGQRTAGVQPHLAPVVMGTSARSQAQRRPVQAAARKKSPPFATSQEVAESTGRQAKTKESGSGLPHSKEPVALAPIVSRSELAFQSPASEEAAFEVLSSLPTSDFHARSANSPVRRTSLSVGTNSPTDKDVRRTLATAEGRAKEEAALFNEVVSLQDGVDWDSAPPIPLTSPLVSAKTSSADGEAEHELEHEAESLRGRAKRSGYHRAAADRRTGCEPGPADHATTDQVVDAPIAIPAKESFAVKPQHLAAFRRLNDEQEAPEPSASDLLAEDDDLWTDAVDLPLAEDSMASLASTKEIPAENSTVQYSLPPTEQIESLPLESMSAEVPQEAWHSPALPGPGVAGCAPTCEPAACGPTVPPWQMYPDEYLCDGGDAEYAVQVNQDWTVRNLDTEDTVGHYDTLDGRVIVEPSNRVCIYAPRFAAVRKVTAVFGK